MRKADNGTPKPKSDWPTVAAGAKEKILLAAAVLAVLAVILVIGNLRVGSGKGLQACKNIIDNIPRYQCIQELAMAERNSSMCLAMPSPNNYSCVYQLALNGSNQQACAVIKGSQLQYYGCIYNVSHAEASPVPCSSLAEPFRSECIYGAAEAQNFSDMATCAQIANQSIASKCITIYDYTKALVSKEASYCGDMPAGQAGASGYLLEATSNITYTDPTTALLYLQGNGSISGYCYYKLAILNSNQSLCANVPEYVYPYCQEFSASSNITASPGPYDNASLNSTNMSAITKALSNIFGNET